MSDRDFQNPYDRSEQYGSSRRGGGSGSSSQASQWQSDDNRQQGGDWRQNGQSGGSDDHNRDYRFSGQGNFRDDAPAYGRGDSQSYGRGQSTGSNYWSQRNDRDQGDGSRGYDPARASYGQHNDRNQGYGPNHDQYGSRDRYESRQSGGQRQSGSRDIASGYAGRDYDASGGNDFGNFTSEDFGGRDFYNRGGGGGAAGGMHPSDTYRPSYGLSSWLHSDDDDRQRGGQDRGGRLSGREEYGDWRKYGESRGFLQRAGDEVASWFGDEDASRRREQDHRQGSNQSQAQSHRGRGPSNYTRSDERIRDDANDHLTHDHHVDASHITVSVKDGELTLDGTVDSRDAKRRAEDCVDHISGVKHVQNNLRVQDRNSSALGSGTSGSAYASSSASSDPAFGQTSGASSGLRSGTSSGSGASGQLGSSSLAGSSTGSTSDSAGTSGTPGSSTTTPGQTGASTTGGIGSTATAGVGSASTPRSSDKSS